MRRKDLAMSQEATLAVIDAIEYAVLSLTDPDGKAYGVPLDYVRKGDCLYFHGAKEGRKVEGLLLRFCPPISPGSARRWTPCWRPARTWFIST